MLAQLVNKKPENKTHRRRVMPLSVFRVITPLVLYIAFFVVVADV